MKTFLRARKKVPTGSVIEFPYKSGFFYAIYTHDHRNYGQLIRVFETFHSLPVSSPTDCLSDEIMFETFYPLSLAANDGLFRSRGSVEVPAQLREFPLFRAGIRNPLTNRISVWWLWDGAREWKVGSELSEEERRYPIREVINHTLLLERFATRWKPTQV